MQSSWSPPLSGCVRATSFRHIFLSSGGRVGVRVTSPTSCGDDNPPKILSGGYGILSTTRESFLDLTFAFLGAVAGPPFLITDFSNSNARARTQSSGAGLY